MGYSANRRKELGASTTLSYSQRRKAEIEQEKLARSRAIATGENARKTQRLTELNAPPINPYEKEVQDALQKIEDRPWYVPRGIAMSIESAKASKPAKLKLMEKNSEHLANTPNAAAGTKYADSMTLGAFDTLRKTQINNTKDEELKDKLQKSYDVSKQNEINHPVASTLGTIAGYITPGIGVEKIAGNVLAPTLAKVGSKVAQKAITGAVTGGGMEMLEGAIRGDNPEELGNRVAAGAGFGAVGDVAFYGLGKGIGSISSKLKAGKALTKAEAEIVKNAPELLPKLSNKSISENPIKVIEKPSKISNGVDSTFFKTDSDIMDVSGHIPSNGGTPFIDNIWYNSNLAKYGDSTDKLNIPQELLGKGNATKNILSVMDYFQDKGIKKFNVDIMSDDSFNLMKSMEKKGYIKQLTDYKFDGDNVTYEILNPHKAEMPITNQKPEGLTNIPAIDEPSLKTDLTKPSTLIPDGEIKERGFSENIRTDANRPDAERAIFDKDPEFYNVLKNETTLSAAQKRFAQGYETALQDFDATKSTLRADNVTLAKLIADEAVKRGDMQTARRVIVDISETLTNAGQMSQAAKILRESNDPSAILTFVEKEIKRMNTQGSGRYGKRWENISLTDDELKKIGAMTGEITDEQKEQLFNELGDSVTARVPTTVREKFDAFRRFSMLFNPKTHIRNIAGNSMMAGLSRVSDTIAATLEKGISPELRTKSFMASKQYKDIAEGYWNANKKTLTEGGRWELFGAKSPFGEKTTFKTKWLETLNDISKKTLEGEDTMFMSHHFKNSLAGFMQARNLKEPTQEAVEHATRRAQEATFREANALAESINKLKGTKAGLIIEAAIPFTKTPANILTTGVRYSPLGLVQSAVQLINKEAPAKVIETFSKGLTGTGLTMMGYYMAKNGLARGEYEKNAKVEGLKQASGELPNSIITPQGSYTVDWAQPASIPFFMGVGMAESLKKSGGNDYVQAGLDALKAGGDSLINQSMLKNIKDLFSGYGSTTEKVMQLPVNYLQQAFPTVGGQIARVADPLKRQSDYTSGMSKMLTGLQARTPIASKSLPLKRDILGQPQKYGEGVLNVIQQFISPGYIAKKSDDPIVNELSRLYESEGSDFLPRASVYRFTKDKVDYDLNNEEVSEFQRMMGEYTKNELAKLIQSLEYKSMADTQKAKRIKAINDNGYELAKQAVMKTREP